MQVILHGPFRDLHRVGDLSHREAFDVEQRDRFTLAVGELGHRRGQARLRDRLARRLDVLELRAQAVDRPVPSLAPPPVVPHPVEGDVAHPGGRVVVGRWERPSLQDLTTFVAKDGTEISLEPGRTWVELLPSSVAVGLE